MNYIDTIYQQTKQALIPYFGDPLEFNKTFPTVPVWTNHLFIKGSLHYGHLELFKSEKIQVIHSNFYSHPLIEAPDLGFDVIWLNGICTGYFFDYSNNMISCLESELKEVYESVSEKTNRQLPSWATSFSPYALLKRPNTEKEVLELFAKTLPLIVCWSKYVQTQYQQLLDSNPSTKDRIYKRNQYIQGLKENPKTINALTSLVGAEETQKFVSEVLYRNLE